MWGPIASPIHLSIIFDFIYCFAIGRLVVEQTPAWLEQLQWVVVAGRTVVVVAGRTVAVVAAQSVLGPVAEQIELEKNYKKTVRDGNNTQPKNNAEKQKETQTLDWCNIGKLLWLLPSMHNYCRSLRRMIVAGRIVVCWLTIFRAGH